ncbi:hypothetical protein HanOQP8_Chr04g0136971 [Helianthus annuus]|nr:hypothetical protein HanLR1_Chr04g0128931 [Helianthus annuus]KAJ0760352.1 hypothetical protein HanOQP8_Chr04g0136971 [Helianthus annuus]
MVRLLHTPNPYHQTKKPQFKLQQNVVEYIILAASVATTTSLSLSSRMVTLHHQKRQHSRNQVRHIHIQHHVPRFSVRSGLRTRFFPTRTQCTTSSNNCDRVYRVNLMRTDVADLVKDALVNDWVELRIIGNVSADI